MATALSRKDFVSDQDVRWCPGCGDYAILAQVQRIMPDFGIPRENIVFISGIGCAARFPYYMNTYGFHTIHGRASDARRSEEHTSELQSHLNLVCRLLLQKKKNNTI